MKSKAVCPKCGSTRIIRQVQVIDRSDSGGQSLSLRRGTRALGGWLKLARTHPLDAWVCGACGYTELYVREPADLVAADQGAVQPPAGLAGAPGPTGSAPSDRARAALIIALLAVLTIGAAVLALLVFFMAR